MKCRSFFRYGLFRLALAVSGLMAVSGHTSARNVPGVASYSTGDGCFTPMFGGVFNQCAETKSLDIPLTVDSSGARTVTVNTYRSAPTTELSCVAIASGAYDSHGWTLRSQVASSAVYGTFEDLVLEGLYVPSSFHVYVECAVGSQGSVERVTYDP